MGNVFSAETKWLEARVRGESNLAVFRRILNTLLSKLCHAKARPSCTKVVRIVLLSSVNVHRRKASQVLINIYIYHRVKQYYSAPTKYYTRFTPRFFLYPRLTLRPSKTAHAILPPAGSLPLHPLSLSSSLCLSPSLPLFLSVTLSLCHRLLLTPTISTLSAVYISF